MLSWFDNYDTLLSVASWAVDHFFFTEPGQVVYFFEKPWKFAELHDTWRAEEEFGL